MLRLPRSDGRTPEWHLQSPGEEKGGSNVGAKCQKFGIFNLMDKILKGKLSLRINSTIIGHLSLCQMTHFEMISILPAFSDKLLETFCCG